MIKSEGKFLNLIDNGLTQSRMNKKTGLSDFEYVEIAESAFQLNPQIQQVLLGGLGAGTMIRHCIEHGSHVNKVVAIELDPHIIALEKQFIAEKDGLSASELPGATVIHDDFAAYLRGNKKKWDLIFIDCFYHIDSTDIYRREQVIRRAYTRLKKGGILVINVFSVPREFPDMVEILMQESFGKNNTLRVPCITTRNTVLFGIKLNKIYFN